jgi:hypothetical protein
LYDWARCKIIFDVPDSKCVVCYSFILRGEGKIWIDNISFEIVNNSTNKTSHLHNEAIPEEWIYQIPKELPQKPPVNLDSED